MYTILVVDDEPRHRKGLISLIQENHPEYKIYESKNGFDAINMITNYCVDIVITDIEMPVMNGIELLKYIHEKEIKIKTIVFSAYGEFEYAQQAIKMGVSDYVIKPVNRKSINETINKLVINLEQEKKLNIQKENLKITVSAYKNQLLNKWIRGHNISSDIYNINDVFSNNAGFISIIQYNIKDTPFFGDINKISQSINAHILPKKGEALVFNDNINKNRVIIIFSSKDNKFELKKNHLVFRNILKDIGQNIDAIGVSACFDHIKISLQKALTQAEDALKYQFYSDNKITYFEDISLTEYHYCKKLEEEKDIIHAILSKNKEKLIISINKLLNSLIQPGQPYISNLKDIIIEIIKNIIIETNNSFFHENRIMDKIENTINDCTSYQNLNGELANIMLEFMNEIHDHIENNNQNLFQKVIDYIEQNYFTDLSLEDMASKLYFSAPYFSKTFKRISGMNFSKYIQSVRIKKAKDLLINSNFKIYEIGNKVGYKDAKYFIRIFKKELGLTPKEYRRLSIDGIMDLKKNDTQA